jgi:predicted nucleotidyltransferase
MKIEQLEILKKDVENSVKELLGDKLKKVILYGSYARGDFDSESDVDFAVIADIGLADISMHDNFLGSICLDLSLKYDALISILIISEVNFNDYQSILPFYANLVKEGIPVYGLQ